ncbi:hypothetical protein [Nocardioides sp. Root140]|uniref:hypothetical protein n=1 Tax=Nocardioides sp. Root140 TaxID=1736460 RepID=UPI0007013D1A|nr:hypothetical protein [Nocardioides sp. Root140]KQY62399.1 hypothetical protein ASD30_23790 [Nocardioides sp. Root140]
MPKTLEAAAVSVRLRRLWLGEIAKSEELAASVLVDAVHDVHLSRVAASRHRLRLAAPTDAARDALGRVPGAPGALVTAVQAFKKQEVPLHRVVVDSSYRGKGLLL